jgi:hypothetical protein
MNYKLKTISALKDKSLSKLYYLSQILGLNRVANFFKLVSISTL